MGDDKPARSASLDDWLRLQQRLVVRTSKYLQSLGDLVGQGSFEPREYIEQSANVWAGVVGDFGDWLKPASERKLSPEQALVCVCKVDVDRGRGSQEKPIAIPIELFGQQESEDTKIPLILSGLVRRMEKLGRPPAVLEPGKHLGIEPNPVTRNDLTDLKLKVFDLSAIGEGGHFEGLLWAVLPGQPAETKVPAAVIELTLV
jgi:hypothetical protein